MTNPRDPVDAAAEAFAKPFYDHCSQGISIEEHFKAGVAYARTNPVVSESMASKSFTRCCEGGNFGTLHQCRKEPGFALPTSESAELAEVRWALAIEKRAHDLGVEYELQLEAKLAALEAENLSLREKLKE